MKTIYQYKTLYCCILIGLGSLIAWPLAAQKTSLDEKPWLRGVFPRVPVNQIYQFKIGTGEDFNYDTAINKAIDHFLTGLGGIDSLNSVCRKEIIEIIKNGEISGESKFECNDQVFQNVVSLNARLDQYEYRTPEGKYKVHILFAFQDPKLHRNTTFDPVTPHYTNHYGWQAGWRSLIVPGWGQFHKKTNHKGIIFLGGVLVSTGVTIYSETQRSDNFRKSQGTTNITLIRHYRNKADESALIRNIAISVAGGLWIWSVIDAMNTKGALRYDYSKNARLYASRDGITLGIRF